MQQHSGMQIQSKDRKDVREDTSDKGVAPKEEKDVKGVAPKQETDGKDLVAKEETDGKCTASKNKKEFRSKYCWRKGIAKCMEKHGETWKDVISCTATDDELNKAFNPGYGMPKGVPFTVWTEDRVYFPACYDGSEWVESVARHPDGHATRHIGDW